MYRADRSTPGARCGEFWLAGKIWTTTIQPRGILSAPRFLRCKRYRIIQVHQPMICPSCAPRPAADTALNITSRATRSRHGSVETQTCAEIDADCRLQHACLPIHIMLTASIDCLCCHALLAELSWFCMMTGKRPTALSRMVSLLQYFHIEQLHGRKRKVDNTTTLQC